MVAAFSRDMKFFQRHFMANEKIQAIFSSSSSSLDDADSIFRHIPQIIESNDRLRRALKDAFERDIFMKDFVDVVTTFLQEQDFYQPFLDYCRDVPLQKRMFSEATKFEKFRKCVSAAETAARAAAKGGGCVYDIITYLTMPMRHITRFHLVLNNLMSVGYLAGGLVDRDRIVAAAHVAKRFSERANTNQALTERADTLLKLFKILVC